MRPAPRPATDYSRHAAQPATSLLLTLSESQCKTTPNIPLYRHPLGTPVIKGLRDSLPDPSCRRGSRKSSSQASVGQDDEQLLVHLEMWRALSRPGETHALSRATFYTHVHDAADLYRAGLVFFLETITRHEL